jgi:uncharacterized metal-binding protein
MNFDISKAIKKVKRIDVKAGAKAALKYCDDHKTTIITTVTVVGVPLTGYFAAKGMHEADKIIYENNEDAGDDESKMIKNVKDAIPHVWKCFVPAFSVGAVTCASAIVNQKLNRADILKAQGTAAIATQMYDEYKSATRDVVGDDCAEKIEQKVVDNRVANVNPDITPVIDDGGGDLALYVDSQSGFSMWTSRSHVMEGINETNREITSGDGFASVATLIYNWGGETYPIQECAGWNANHLIDAKFTPMSVGTTPCFRIDYINEPIEHCGVDKFQM